MGFGFLLPSTSRYLGHKDLSPQLAPGYKAAPDWDHGPTHPRAFSLQRHTRAHGSAQHPIVYLPLAHPSQGSPTPTPRGTECAEPGAVGSRKGKAMTKWQSGQLAASAVTFPYHLPKPCLCKKGIK